MSTIAPHDDPGRACTRLGLIGAECTGKSALATVLAARFGATVAGECLRGFVEANGRPPQRDEQRELMRLQQQVEDELALVNVRLIADPLPLLTAVYSLAYFDDPGLLGEGLERVSDYDLVVWCRPDLPWVADGGQRDGPQWRERVDTLLRDDIIARVAARTRVMEATGSLEERAHAVGQAWQQPPGLSPT